MLALARLAGVAALLGLAAAAGAQPPAGPAAPTRGAFVVLVGQDTLLVERFLRTADSLRGEALRRGSGGERVRYAAALAPDATVPAIEIRAWPPAADTGTPPQRQARVRFAGDTAHVVGGEGGRAISTTPGAVPYHNPLAAHLEQVVRRGLALAGGRRPTSGTVQVPLFLLDGGRTVPATLRWQGADSVIVTVGENLLRLAVDAAGRLLGGIEPSANLRIRRVDSLPAALFTVAAPDYSAPAGAPYRAEVVRVARDSGVTLVGTLTVPTDRPRPYPAVLLVSGSSPQNRDYDAANGRYRLFRWLADTLSRRGIAVLRVDDRGVGQSTGRLETATIHDRADDARAELAVLRDHPLVDARRIAVLGISEGGAIAPMLAASDSTLAAVVTLAGPASTGREVITYQLRYGIERDTTLAPAARDSALRVALGRVDSAAATDRWLRAFLQFDPLPYARRVTQPALVLHGSTDRNVPVADAPALARALRERGSNDVTLRVLQDVNHILVPDPVGDPDRYGALPSLRVPPATLGLIADWLAARLRS